MIRLILSALVLSLCINNSVGYEIDLSTANGFEWEAALPNKSIISFYYFVVDIACCFYDYVYSSKGIQVPGRVPGSIYTDLDEANIFTGGPLLFRFNDLDYRWVSYEDWDYSLTFQGV